MGCAFLLSFGGAIKTAAAPIETLFNTGVSDTRELLTEGELDPHYTLLFSPDPGFPGPDAFALLPGFPVGPWLEEGPDSRWIAPQANQSTGNEPGSYTFSTTFVLDGLDPATAVITGRMSADNSVTAVRLNGLDLGLTSGGFNAWFPFSIPEGAPFLAGVNTLEFDVSNAGDTANPVGLRVEMTGRATGAGEAPMILMPPQAQEVLVGAPAMFTVQASGTPPLSFQWNRNGTPIANATEASFRLEMASTNDAGDYSVTVSSPFGMTNSAAVQLRVLIPFPGIFDTGVSDERMALDDYVEDPHYKLVVNPTDPGTTTTYVEDSFLFPIIDGPWLANTARSKWIGPIGETGAAAGGDYTYQLVLNLDGYDPATAYLAGSWASDNAGTLYLNGADTGFSSPGFGSFSTFVLESGFVSGANRLEFRVNNAAEGYTGLRVENLRGTAEKGTTTATAPRIVTQPKPASKVITENYTFTVVADGAAPLSYQWFRNGTAIDGATQNSYAISPILAGASGTYSVRVTNTLGSATSDAVELTVFQPALGVFNTGVDTLGQPLALGTADPHYVLLASGDPAFPPPLAYAASGAPIPPWLANTETSQWIAPRPSGVDAAPATYQYRLIFSLQASDVATAALSASVATDDGNGGIRLNGQPVDFGASGFGGYTDLRIPEGSPFVAGLNTLDFFVSNGGTSANPTGLRVENILLTGATQPPLLGIAREGDGGVRLSWPVAAAGFRLQETGSIPGGWMNSGVAVTVEGSLNVARPVIGAGARFYRLTQ